MKTPMSLLLSPKPRSLIVTLLVSVVAVLAGCGTVNFSPGLEGKSSSLERVLVPRIRGELLQGESPLAGRQLRLSHNEGRQAVCEFPLEETSTNEQGEFDFPAKVDEMDTGVLERVENDWQVCVLSPDAGWTLIWFESHSGVMFGEKSSRIECDLDRLADLKSGNRSFLGKLTGPRQVCTLDPVDGDS